MTEMQWRSFTQDIKEIKSDIHDIKTTLNGTPSSPDKGLKVRVDRLEQTSKLTTWITKTAIGGAIAAMGTAIWSVIKKG